MGNGWAMDEQWMGNGTCAIGHEPPAITIAHRPLPIHIVDQLGITTVLITWMTPLL